MTSHPAGGSSFEGGTDGWVGSAHACEVTLLVLPLPLANLCTSETVHDGAAGSPPGSISARTNVTLNLLSLFSGSSRWTSPGFTVPAGQVVGATVSLDRALSPGGLLNVGLTSTYTVTLHNLTTGNSTPVMEEALTPGETAFATRGEGVEITPGHAYQLTIDTATSSTIGLSLFSGATETRFDNVALTVESGGPGGPGGGPGGGGTAPGGTTPVVSPGVRIVRGPYSNTEIRNIMNRIDINAATGPGPGGSLVPLELCTIVGTAGRDRIIGTRGNDVICGLGGNDIVIAGNGHDLVDGGNGNDRINGGRGNDVILGLRGNDRLSGGAGNDGIGGGAGNDIIHGGRGNDRLHGSLGADRIFGGAGNDRIAGGPGNDRLMGGPGRDRIAGGRGNDLLIGGPGADRLLGGPGRDRIQARDGARDIVRGGPGRDWARVDRLDRVAGVQRVLRPGR